MSSFINVETGEWPLHQGDLDLMYGANIPETIRPLIYMPQEGAGKDQTYDKKNPIEIDGVWIVTWTIRDKTVEELEREKQIEEAIWQRLKG